MTRVSRLVLPETRETFWRTLQTFTITRIVIVTLLIVYLLFSAKNAFPETERFEYGQIAFPYLILAIGFAALAIYRRRRFLLQLLSQITLDIVVTSILFVVSGGAKGGLAILYLFPLSGAAILAPLLVALFFAAAVSLVLLGETGYRMFATPNDLSISQAGLYGAAFFVAVFTISRLAARLIKQEDLAARRGYELQVQEAINRLVIADMGDGILVVGRDTTVITSNPAAERMLGFAISGSRPRYRMTDVPSLAPIVDAFLHWTSASVVSKGRAETAPIFVVVKPGDDGITIQGAIQGGVNGWDRRRELAAHLKLRFATVEASGLNEERWVIFLSDVTEIENQAQQLKLASMGRLTASIAHEVRNPLSAISYAASLLEEELTSSPHKRLINIVGDNVSRLNRMIEDILKLSRKANLHGEPISVIDVVTEILTEFQDTHGLLRETVDIDNMGEYRVWFDPLHLREVLVNLISNALRYASGKHGSIRIRLVSGVAGRFELHVQDDGEPIGPEVRAHLFEPFYTTSSKGTGLGLYLARELCLNNGAMLDYEYRADGGGEDGSEASGRFVITLASASTH